jgi:APA family basic amino acid/polyamine antiporter
LSLIDATSMMVGIIIGSTIYESSPSIAAGAAKWATEMVQVRGGATSAETQLAVVAIVGFWLTGGLIALIGSLCYAELATAYPRAGGTYVYLSQAFGREVGFAFAWAEFWIVRPGNVGAVAFVLAKYGRKIVLPQAGNQAIFVELALATTAIITLAVLNAIGLRTGKTTQNLLTATKLIGLAAIVATACSLSAPAETLPIVVESWQGPSLSLILIMFAYGGWADVSFVAAEVRDPQRNISRTLMQGALTVTAIYLAVTLSFVWALGVGGLVGSQAVAAKLMALRFGASGSMAMSLLVVVSCLGSINGMMFAGARVFYALGEQHPTFRWLGVWNESKGIPLRSLVVQTLVTLGLILGFGLYAGGFQGLVIFTGPFYWGFIGLVGLALIVLRSGPPRAEGSYRAPFYPLLPVVLFASSAAMAGSAVLYVLQQRGNLALWLVGAWWAAGVVVTGVVVGIIDWRTRRR